MSQKISSSFFWFIENPSSLFRFITYPSEFPPLISSWLLLFLHISYIPNKYVKAAYRSRMTTTNCDPFSWKGIVSTSLWIDRKSSFGSEAEQPPTSHCSMCSHTVLVQQYLYCKHTKKHEIANCRKNSGDGTGTSNPNTWLWISFLDQSCFCCAKRAFQATLWWPEFRQK